MYGPPRVNYNSHRRGMEGAETPNEENGGTGYFDYVGQPTSWNNTPQQQNMTPGSVSSDQSRSASNHDDPLLDPMEEMENGLMGFENTEFPELMTPVATSIPLPTIEDRQMMNMLQEPVAEMPNPMQTQIQNPMQMPMNQMSRMQNQMQNRNLNIQNQNIHASGMNQNFQNRMSNQLNQSMQNQNMQNQSMQNQSMQNQNMQSMQNQNIQSQLQTRLQNQNSQLGMQMRIPMNQLNVPIRMSPGLSPGIPVPRMPIISQTPVPTPSRTATSSVNSVTTPTPQALVVPNEKMKIRMRYKPRSSIPPDLSSINYASQCIAAAESSRLNPYSLSLGEYNHLRNLLPLVHVTTYLNIRNGILRLWLANPLVSVTQVEAVGCCKEARYYPLAEFAFEWLVRNGYINQGCYKNVNRTATSVLASQPQFSSRKRKPRQTIVIIGAGVAGLCCARQLENLLERYSSQILIDYEELPRVLVLEGRKRIGGRVYSPMLSTERTSVDLGGDTIMGFGGGNPLGVVMRRQLGIPVVSVDTTSDSNVLYSTRTGDPIGAQADYRAHELFKHLLDRMRNFEMGQGAMGQSPSSISGVKSLIRASQDPRTDLKGEMVTIGQFEEDQDRPYTRASTDSSDNGEENLHEVKAELDFLQNLGFPVERANIDKDGNESRVHAEQTDHGVSLGLTMAKLVDHLSKLTTLSDDERAALYWYFAKFEYQIGDNIDRASLSSWSHHRQNRFTGRYAWARDGMGTLLRGLDTVPGKLDVRFKTVVNVVEYEDDSSQLTLENGEQVQVDRCVVTVPLGCLKKRTMQFIPDLPQWKTDSIDRLEYGVVNKVVLVFEEPFWDANMPSLIRVANDSVDKDHRGECFIFQNHTKRCDVGTKALIVGLVSGSAASNMSEETDSVLVDRAVEKLRLIFRAHPKAKTVKLVESIVTRWQVDRFSKGTFSHVGVEGTSTDHDLLARPVLRSLFFAGEATCRSFPGTLHGAYISGLRAAKEVINSLVGGIEVPEKLIDDDLAKELLDLSNNVRQARTPQEIPQEIPQEMQHDIQHEMQHDMQHEMGRDSRHEMHIPSIQQQQQQTQQQQIPPVVVRAHSPAKRNTGSPDLDVDYEQAETELKELRQHRQELEREQLERDMMHEIGQKPVKPERHGITNPFLLFQKDYWDICRQETEAHKRRDRKHPSNSEVHASRNEIRAGLGKKWRSLPEEERAPYIERSRLAKIENEERQDAYIRKLKWYQSEAANFQQQWVQEHPSYATPREVQLEGQLEHIKPKKKRSRLTE